MDADKIYERLYNAGKDWAKKQADYDYLDKMEKVILANLVVRVHDLANQNHPTAKKLSDAAAKGLAYTDGSYEEYLL